MLQSPKPGQSPQSAPQTPKQQREASAPAKPCRRRPAAQRTATPAVDSTKIGNPSRRSSRQRRESAASNKSGGRNAVVIRCGVSSAPGPCRARRRPIPASTSPTVYGSRSRRASGATTTAITSSPTVRSIVNPMSLSPEPMLAAIILEFGYAVLKLFSAPVLMLALRESAMV